MKFAIKDFFRKCDQIRRKLLIWPHLLKKSLMETSFLVQWHRILLALTLKDNSFYISQTVQGFISRIFVEFSHKCLYLNCSGKCFIFMVFRLPENTFVSQLFTPDKTQVLTITLQIGSKYSFRQALFFWKPVSPPSAKMTFFD